MRHWKIGCGALLVLLLLLGGVGAYKTFHTPGLNRDFDPAAVAASETRMWKAYYTRDKEDLGMALSSLMHEQLGLSVANSLKLTFVLGKATMTFATAKGSYEQVVLPGLTEFYTQARELSGGTWDAQAVAKAELDWWVARRTPGEDSAEQVGAKIARLYELLYGSTNEHLQKAGLLRAQAATIRDAGGPNADWPRIEAMLVESYTELKGGIAQP